MKHIAIFLILPLFVASKPHKLPEIKVYHEKSINGVPSIDITFPNGLKDNFILERHYMSETDKLAKKLHCNFIGHLEKDPESCVSVTGCMGEKLEFTINSKHALNTNMYVLHENGILEEVENPFQHESTSSEILNVREDGNWELVNGDEFENAEQIAEEMQFEANCNAGQCSSLPTTNLMRIKVNLMKLDLRKVEKISDDELNSFRPTV